MNGSSKTIALRFPARRIQLADVVLSTLVALLFASLPGCGEANQQSREFPNRPIKVIVPFAAGGGSDTFARIIQSAVEKEKLLAEKLVIINVSGAGGTIGSRRVKNAHPDGYTVLLLHDGIMTAKYSGKATYGPEAFLPIAGSGDTSQVIAVSEQSPYQSLADLMDDAARRPNEIVFAANVGAPSYYAGLMLEEQKPGSSFRYTQTGGGAKRFAALNGDHVEVTSFSVAEFVQFRSAGLRALAILGNERHPHLSDVETAKEQGFDVVIRNMQFWWAPRGTPPENIRVIADGIERAMASESVREQLEKMSIDPLFLEGKSLEEEIRQRSSALAAVSSRSVAPLPNFPLIVLGVVLGLGLWVWWLSRGTQVGRRPADRIAMGGISMANSILTVTVAYVACLQFTPIGFRGCTACFVFAVGWLVAKGSGGGEPSRKVPKSVAAWLACVALGLSLGIHYLFTQVLVVDLP